MPAQYYVYILANHRNGTLYTGFTNNLIGRTFTHKSDIVDGFTKKYQVHRLVYYEVFEDRDAAIKREKQLKRWHRKWKLELIEKINPGWKDLYDQIIKG
jgi:putative endonuclease